MPVIGMIPMVMPTLTNICMANMAAMPVAKKVPNGSVAWVAIR